MCYFYLAFMVSSGKSALIQIIAPLKVISHFFSSCFQDFSLSLFFQNWIMICLGMDFFWFILFRVLSTSESRFISSAKFVKFLAIISSTIFSVPSSFSSSFGTSPTWMLDLLLFSYRSLRFFCFSFLVYTLSVDQIGWFLLFSDSLFC